MGGRVAVDCVWTKLVASKRTVVETFACPIRHLPTRVSSRDRTPALPMDQTYQTLEAEGLLSFPICRCTVETTAETYRPLSEFPIYFPIFAAGRSLTSLAVHSATPEDHFPSPSPHPVR